MHFSGVNWLLYKDNIFQNVTSFRIRNQKLASLSLRCEAAALQQKISKFYLQILSTEASYHMSVSGLT